eukprot:g5981.t1
MCTATSHEEVAKSSLHCDTDPTDAVSDLFKHLTLRPRRSTVSRNANAALKQPENWKRGMPRVGLLYDEVMLHHCGPFGEFEKPGRVSVPFSHLTKEGIIGRCFTIDHRPALTSELAWTHSIDYINRVATGNVDLKEDVFWNQKTDSSARMAAGCCIIAVEAVLDSSLDTAFVLSRPPGHHAEFDTAKGFCFYNNASIAAMSALKNESRCKRVVILDWDVHHGNGTQNTFYKDDQVLYISLHRGGHFYPGTGSINEIGEDKGKGYTMNISWPEKGFGNADYLVAFKVLVEPLISAFNPDLTIISAGFDAVVHDPLGGFQLTPDCFGHLTRRVLNLSPKTVMLLEGGYNLLQLTACIRSCLKVLLGEEPQPLEQKKCALLPQTKETIRDVARQLLDYWPCLSIDAVEERMLRFEECTR